MSAELALRLGALVRAHGGPVVGGRVLEVSGLIVHITGFPVRVGDVVVLTAQVNCASRTSMEVGCRVETEDMATHTRRKTTKAYLTFVSVDEHGAPRAVPALDLDNDDDRRRHADALARRADRLRASGRAPQSTP